jgi:hypothetical protein
MLTIDVNSSGQIYLLIACYIFHLLLITHYSSLMLSPFAIHH